MVPLTSIWTAFLLLSVCPVSLPCMSADLRRREEFTTLTGFESDKERFQKATSADITALYSEIMMYVLLVFLTFWLLVEMVYCYRKISKSDEQAQDTATDYLAIPSENKENPGPAVTE